MDHRRWLALLLIVMLTHIWVPAGAESIDLSALSQDELLALNALVYDTFESLQEYEPFEVPAGTWEVGKNIPTGSYRIYADGSEPLVEFSAYKDSLGTGAFLGSCSNILNQSPYAYFPFIQLDSGAIVTINSGSVKFAPPNPVIRLSEKAPAKYDMSGYTRDELVQLNRQVVKALNGMASFEPFVVPLGQWHVGIDFPSGYYRVSMIDDYDTWVQGVESPENRPSWSYASLFDYTLFGFGDVEMIESVNMSDSLDNLTVAVNWNGVLLSPADENIMFGPQ